MDATGRPSARAHPRARSEVEAEWWLWPSPAGAWLDLACEWPAFGIAETHVRLDLETFAWADLDAGDERTRREWARRTHPNWPARRPPEPEWIEPHVVAATVSRARHAAGVSVEELAAKLGFSVDEVTALEAGDVELELAELALIGQALGTGVHLYFDGMVPADEAERSNRHRDR
jgi:hypothetical protein